MDIRRLEEFMVIAQESSMKDAAEKLGLPPATLSSRLSAFERDLDRQLFVRGHSSLQLTDAGTRLYNSGTEILAEYRRLLREMEFVHSNTISILRIGLVGNGLPFHLGPYLDIVNQRNPQIRIDLLEESSYTFPDSLLSGEIDLFMGPVLKPFHHDEIICQTIAPPHANILMPISHPLAQSDTISLRQLERETFILYPENASPFIRDFQLTNLQKALQSYETYESNTAGRFIKCLVPVGKGLLITPDHDPDLLPHCIRRPLTDLPAPAPESILYLRNPWQKDLKILVNDFMKFVKERDYPGH